MNDNVVRQVKSHVVLLEYYNFSFLFSQSFTLRLMNLL